MKTCLELLREYSLDDVGIKYILLFDGLSESEEQILIDEFECIQIKPGMYYSYSERNIRKLNFDIQMRFQTWKFILSQIDLTNFYYSDDEIKLFKNN